MDSESSAGTIVAWHIVVSLMSGIIIGILLCYIIWYCRRRWFRKRKPEQNPEAQTTEADTTYQELDLSKMNTEYNNYQSLRGNAAKKDAGDEDDSTYTDLNKIRDDENTYQSLILT